MGLFCGKLCSMIMEQMAGGGAGGAGANSTAPADWSINDPNAAGYVKNRTHWSEETNITVICDEGAESFNDDDHIYIRFYNEALTQEDISSLSVNIAGVTLTPYYKRDIDTGVSVYAATLMDMEIELFAAVYEGNGLGITPGMYTNSGSPLGYEGNASLVGGGVHKLDLKYIPQYYLEFARGEGDTVENVTCYPSTEDFIKMMMAGGNLYVMEKGTIGAAKIYQYTGMSKNGSSLYFATPIDKDGNIHFIDIKVGSNGFTGTLSSKTVTLV